MFFHRPGSPHPASITPFVDAARSFLSAVPLPVLDEPSPPDASGFRVLPYNAVAVTVAPVVDGLRGTWDGTALRPGWTERWRNMDRQARDVITAAGWGRVADTPDGGSYSPPVAPLHPLVQETVHVLERDGQPYNAEFDVSLLDSGAVKVDVVGGLYSHQFALSDVAAPALYAAGFDFNTVDYDGETSSRSWCMAHHLVARSPMERRKEWALAHTVRRLIQAEHRDPGRSLYIAPAEPSDLPEGSAPDAHLGALFFQFPGRAADGPGAFDLTLQKAGHTLGPTRHERQHHVRILRPARSEH